MASVSDSAPSHLSVSGTLVLAALASSMLVACPAPTESRSADSSRALSPVPSCVRALHGERSADGFSAPFPEDEYWGLVVPAYQNESTAIGPKTQACNGETVFANPAFDETKLHQHADENARITYGGGANRIRVLWLRTHDGQGEEQAGPLALVRTHDQHVEVYAVGSYKGDPERTRFSLERLGGEVVVTVVQDGCSGSTAPNCDTVLDVLRPTAGRLTPIARIGLERVRETENLEPGVSGPLSVRLSSSPDYGVDGIHVVEEVTISDKSGRQFRKAEQERDFLIDGEGVRPVKDSLWERIYVSRSSKADEGTKEQQRHGSEGAELVAPDEADESRNAAADAKEPPTSQ